MKAIFGKLKKMKKFALCLGGAIITGFGINFLYLNEKRKIHPLMKQSFQILASDDFIINELGEIRRKSFLIHEMSNPHDNEYGLKFELKGKKANVEVTLIGDYLYHKDLIKMNADKNAIFSKCADNEQILKEAKENSDYVPVNIGKFFITTNDSSKENIRNVVIEENEKIWRIKQLNAVANRANLLQGKKLIQDDSLLEIAISKYELKTYGDAFEKQKKEKSLLNPAEEKIYNILGAPTGIYSNYKKWIYYSLPLVLGLCYLAWSKLKGKAVYNSAIYKYALYYAKENKEIKNHIGNFAGILGASGKVYYSLKRANIKLIIYGNKDIGTLKAKSSKIGPDQWIFKSIILNVKGKAFQIKI